MTYEVYRIVFQVSAIASAVMLAVTVLLFFLLRIPKVVNDLTGRSARKAIEDIRKQTEDSSGKLMKAGSAQPAHSMTDKISRSGNQHKGNSMGFGTVTEKIATQSLPDEGAGETTVLMEESGATTVLTEESGATTVLDGQAGETTLLAGEMGATSALGRSGEGQVPQEVPSQYPGGVFQVEFDITYLHTNELIS